MVASSAKQDVVAGAEGAPGAQELQNMLAAFLAAVEASLDDGTLQAADASPTSGASLHEQKVLLAQLQSEKDLLQSRLQCFEQVEIQCAYVQYAVTRVTCYMRVAYLSVRFCCLAEQEEQEWLQLMRETEDTAEEASPHAAAGEDAHCPGSARFQQSMQT